MSNNPPQTLLTWFRFVIPAQGRQERLGFLSGFKKMAPPAFSNEAMQVIQQVLMQEEFDDLQRSLV